MARQYYYLIASLPNLVFEHEAKNFDLLQLKEFVREYLHSSDYRKVELLFSPIDIQNVLNLKLYQHLPFVNGGRFESAEQLEQAIKDSNNQPVYISSFLQSLNDIENEEKEENEIIENPERTLYEQFYAYVEKDSNNFIRDWFRFDRELRNIQAAFVARKINTDAQPYLVGDDDIIDLLKHNNSSDFGLRRERDYMDKLWQVFEITDVFEREKRLDLLRWAYIDELTTFNYFDLNVVLAFLQKANIIVRWMKLDVETGVAMFEQLVSELKETYNAEEAFNGVN